MAKKYYTIEKYKVRQTLNYVARRFSKLATAQTKMLLESQGISFVQYTILMHVRDGSAVTASEISQHICHDTGALARLIDQMEDRGLLKRERSETDRRRNEMRLTPAGKKALADILPVVVDFWNDLLADFSHEEIDQMILLLKRMTDKLTDLPKG